MQRKCSYCGTKVTKSNLGFVYYGEIACKKCKNKKGGFVF